MIHKRGSLGIISRGSFFVAYVIIAFYMLACVVLILLVILPWFGGSDYPNISDFIGLLGDIVKVIV